ncbi:MAG: ATP-dependent sacrificial sulfur transferase LarE [Candidatus Margulisiibacteriota bacterium]
MNKLLALKKTLKKMGPSLIAFSGGVDSSFLCAVAKEVLGDNVIAVTAVSETYPKSELKDAKKLAKLLKIRHKIIKTKEFDDKKFISNPPQRCYFCKKELFEQLKAVAKEQGVKTVLDASNYDDLKDFRPGSRAKKELGVRSPLQESKMTKADIRKFSRQLNLTTWNKPACACLASRIPYGEKLSKEKLRRIEEAEKILKRIIWANGRLPIRVRAHNNIARIEIDPSQIQRIFKGDIMSKIARKLKDLGFAYVTLDLQGFRSGSMNEGIKKWKKK